MFRLTALTMCVVYVSPFRQLTIVVMKYDTILVDILMVFCDMIWFDVM